ncbi:hypothetical protein CCACVL1_12680 [Corchorus capsularis]|uniref:DUF538 domain-containing protein n=1 Tax=Corchorus capsularis TaxID=210143 RepID=A0A1R3IEH6_COCAP|nr:hypothetical protein CCACVL1_12680 [Corchorus capsularis]
MAASTFSLPLLFLTLFFQTHLSFSTIDPTIDHIRPLSSSTSDLYDLLPKYGLPKGIVPDNVKSYTLSSNRDFTVELESTCYVHFDDQLVYYEKNIKGKLSYGAVHDASGIQAKKLFLWLPVTGIEVDESSGMVEFFVGALSKKLPAKEFEEIPVCKSKAVFRADLVSSM